MGNTIGSLSGWNERTLENNLKPIRKNNTGEGNYIGKHKNSSVFLVCYSFINLCVHTQCVKMQSVTITR